jgi:hypothetical protein
MRSPRILAVALAATALVSSAAQAQPTTTSPAGGALPSGVTAVGGIVADLIGTNGNRVVSQLSASSLFRGFSHTGTPAGNRGNPLTIGVQSGFGAATIAALGGGLQRAAFRITLYDGDTGENEFDFNDNFFQVNGVEVGSFSNVTTVETNSTGAVLNGGATFEGFLDETLSTGFFFVESGSLLGNIFSSLQSTGELRFLLRDVDPTDNEYDFTRGLAGSVIDVGQGPIVTPPPGNSVVPEPSTYVLMATGLLGVVGLARRRTRA